MSLSDLNYGKLKKNIPLRQNEFGSLNSNRSPKQCVYFNSTQNHAYTRHTIRNETVDNIKRQITTSFQNNSRDV